MTWICPNCEFRIEGGAHFDEEKEHVCDQRSVARVEASKLDDSFAAFLATPLGQFETYDARRRIT